MAAAVSGKDTNPIATTLEHAYGSGAGRTLLILLAIGFTSSMIAVQTAVTRAIWASARDRVLPGDPAARQALRAREPAPVRDRPDHRRRRRTDLRRRVQGVHAAGVVLRVRLHPVVLHADRRRWRYKHWRGESPTGDAWGARWIRVVTTVAAVWLTAEIVNLVWPRAGVQRLVPQLGRHHHDRRARRLIGALIVLADLPAGARPPGRPEHAGRPWWRRRTTHDAEAPRRRPSPSSPARPAGSAPPAPRLMRRSGWRTAGIDLNPSDTDLPLQADVSDRAAVRGGGGSGHGAVRPDRPPGHRGRLLRGGHRRRRDHRRAVGPDALGDPRRHGELLRRGAAAHAQPRARDRSWRSPRSWRWPAAPPTCTTWRPRAPCSAWSSRWRWRSRRPASGSTRWPRGRPTRRCWPPDSLWRKPDYLATLPLGRLVTPEEIAHAVYYLATEGSMYCGEVLSPNAGAVI